jgi:hypothetical protein
LRGTAPADAPGLLRVVGEAAKRPLIKIETKIVPKAVTLVLFTIAWLKLCSSANLCLSSFH